MRNVAKTKNGAGLENITKSKEVLDYKTPRWPATVGQVDMMISGSSQGQGIFLINSAHDIPSAHKHELMAQR